MRYAKLAARPARRFYDRRRLKVSPEAERAAIEPAVARGVQVVREHRASIGRGQRLLGALFGELEEASDNRDEIEEAIQLETVDDKDSKRRAMMLRAVALPSRASVIVNFSNALRTLVGLERQAFNLGDALDGNDRAADAPVFDRAALGGSKFPTR